MTAHPAKRTTRASNSTKLYPGKPARRDSGVVKEAMATEVTSLVDRNAAEDGRGSPVSGSLSMNEG